MYDIWTLIQTKNMKLTPLSHIYAALCLILSFPLQAQSFQITSGMKTKTIKSTDYIDITYGQYDGSMTACCSFYEVDGYILSSTNDSLEMKLNSFIYNKNFLNEPESYTDNIMSTSRYLKIPKNQVISLQLSKSEKSAKNKGISQGIGTILLLGSLVTTLNAFALEKDSRKNLFRLSAIEAGVGIGLIIAGKKKKYTFIKKEDPWRFN